MIHDLMAHSPLVQPTGGLRAKHYGGLSHMSVTKLLLCEGSGRLEVI